MKVLVVAVVMLLAGITAKADVLIVYSQLANGHCRISVQFAPDGSNQYCVVSYVDVLGPCDRKPGPYSNFIQVDPNSELGRTIRRVDPKADLKKIKAVDEETFRNMQKRPATKNPGVPTKDIGRKE